MKKENLSLRGNHPVIDQQKKRMVRWVLNVMRPIKGRSSIWLRPTIFEGVDSIDVKFMVVVDHGWLIFEVLSDLLYHQKSGRIYEGIYQSKVNNRIGSRDVDTKTSLAKGRKVCALYITLKKEYRQGSEYDSHRSIVVFDPVSGKLFPSCNGNLGSPDWDANHPKALDQIRRAVA